MGRRKACKPRRPAEGHNEGTSGVITALAVCMAFAAFAEEIGWQEAVTRLAYERTKAETCVKELKKYGDKAAISRGEGAFDNARDEFDPIINGLIVAVAKKISPEVCRS